jgi:hypothetical protein
MKLFWCAAIANKGENLIKKIALAVIVLSSIKGIGAQSTVPKSPYATSVKIHMTDGHTKWWEPYPATHRTIDHSYLESTALSAFLTVADMENAHYALTRPGTHEFNAIFGYRPTRDTYYATSGVVFAAMAYMSYRYKREDDALKAAGLPGHKIVKWWVPNALNSTAHFVGVFATLAATGK